MEAYGADEKTGSHVAPFQRGWQTRAHYIGRLAGNTYNSSVVSIPPYQMVTVSTGKG